jgi:hypothetical protein
LAYAQQVIETRIEPLRKWLYDMSTLRRVAAVATDLACLTTGRACLFGDPSEEVTTMTRGSYAERAGLEQFTLVEIDADGHDLAVPRGHGSFSPVSEFQSRNLSSTTAGSMGAATCAMLSISLSPSATRLVSSPRQA